MLAEAADKSSLRALDPRTVEKGSRWFRLPSATYTYSLNGKQKTVKDATGNLTTYEYDGLDRMSKMLFPIATTGAGTSSTTDYEQYGYDTVGNRTSLRKRDGKVIAYVYDGLNRVRSAASRPLAS